MAAARQIGRGAALGFGRGGGRERELVRQATAPISGSRRVVVLSIKGGVGKTTTVAVMGSLLAALRGDRVVALDASSDWGTLAARLSVVPRQTVRELAARGRHAVSEHGILAQLVASPSGLYVVGSDPQSMVSAALGEEEYLQAVHLLEYVANLVLIDVGAGLQQSFLLPALRSCDQLVVATAATWDSVQSAGAALDWLSAHGFAGLVERSVVVMSALSTTRRRRRGHVAELHADLARRCRVLHEIPFDPALQPGGRILLRKLAAETRLAFLQVAADVVGGAVAPPPAGGLRPPNPANQRPASPYRPTRRDGDPYSDAGTTGAGRGLAPGSGLGSGSGLGLGAGGTPGSGLGGGRGGPGSGVARPAGPGGGPDRGYGADAGRERGFGADAGREPRGGAGTGYGPAADAGPRPGGGLGRPGEPRLGGGLPDAGVPDAGGFGPGGGRGSSGRPGADPRSASGPGRSGLLPAPGVRRGPGRPGEPDADPRSRDRRPDGG